MNAPIRKFAAALSVAAATAALGACAGALEAQTDPTSPVAPRVQALVDANREYPRWADFPRSLEPEPEPAVIAARVATLETTSGELAAAAARIEWLTDVDATTFAESVRARVEAVEVAPVTAETAAEIEAFARQARERGRAPPPIARR